MLKNTKEFNPKDQDKVICIETLVHSADISNPMKPFPIYFQWTERVLEEFFNQGDKERDQNMQISYLMDRYSVNKAKSQIGFIDVIVQPHFEVVKNFLPELSKYLKTLEINRKEWEEKVEKYVEELETSKKKLITNSSSKIYNISEENNKLLVKESKIIEISTKT